MLQPNTMACYHPRAAWRGTTTGQLHFGAPRTNATPGAFEWCPVPCGSCIGCRSTKALTWAHRCWLEHQRHTHTAWVTLTYENGTVPQTPDNRYSLSLRHIQLFLKRLRHTAGPLRYFLCGEYGSQRGRPHYHAILYGLSYTQRELIDQTWQHGRISTAPVNARNIKYTAGYSNKKLDDHEIVRRAITYDAAGNPDHKVPEFIQMSRRPGLASHARQWVDSWKDYAVMDGIKLPVSRYLHEPWRQQATETELEQHRLSRKENALSRDTSPDRLRDAELLAKARHRLQTEQRQLR